MITPEIIVAIITLLILGLLLVLAPLRWRLKEPAVYHLTLYTGLAFTSNVFILMALLDVDIDPSLLHYDLAIEFTLLAMILSFGALTLTFLKRGRGVSGGYISYWVAATLILATSLIFALDVQGWTHQAIIMLAGMGLGIGGSEQLVTTVMGLGWVFSLSTVLIDLSLGLKQHQPTQYLNRLRYWLIITTLLGITGLSLFISPQLSFYMVGLSLLSVATALTGYNVLSRHTPDLKLLFGWGLHHIGMLAILAGITLAGFVGAVELYQRIPNSTNPWAWLTILAVLLAIAYRPLIRSSNRLLTATIFGRSRRDEKQMIKRYNQSISSTLDLRRLSDITVNLMTETLNIDRGVVFVNEREGSGEISLRPYSAIGPSEVSPRSFKGDSPFVKHFIQKKAILSQYDLDIHPEFRALAEEERRWLAALGIELYVPILRGQALLGVLAFGPHAKGTSYSQDEKELMMMLADQSGLAFEGALLFQQLATVNEEVGVLSDRLSVLDRSKSDFLSIASHELRTPLTQIHTYSQLLLEFTEEDLQDESYVQTVFEGIARGSERMKEVIDMMLDVSAADLGTMHLFAGPVSLREVFEQAIQPFSAALEERRLQLSEAGLAKLPTIEADGTRLVQVLENLIGNAIKYTPDGGTITVRGGIVKDHQIGPAVEIAIIDQGIGIDAAHQETIFDKFFRVEESRFHSTSKTNFKGAGPGLGLTLVKAIIQAHKGRVWVDSPGFSEEKCPGSIFHVVIPLSVVAVKKRERNEIKTEVERVL